MKKEKNNRKSFTLLEILIATTIFVIIMVTFISVLWAILRPKSKTQTMSVLQQSAQAAMDNMVYSVVHANNSQSGNVNFAITDSGGGAIPCPGTCSGDRITTFHDILKNGNLEKSAYELVYVDTDGSQHWVSPGFDCPSGKTCRLRKGEVDAAGHITYHDMLPAQVDITRLEFRGYYWTATNPHNIAPYLTITMILKNHYTDPASSGTYILRTTVRPNEMLTSNINESLIY